MRALDELIDPRDPALPLLEEWLEDASSDVELLPVTAEAGAATLVALQVSTRSLLGTLAHHTGGLLIDGGWLRVLGGGGPRLPRDLAVWNRVGEAAVRLPGAMLVGDDVIGGFFAIDGGAFGGPPGRVWYLPPETLEWESLDLGHADWVHWAITGDVAGFYEEQRWPGWEAAVRDLAPDQAFSVYPLPFVDGPPFAERSRAAVPVEELWGLYAIELPRQLAGGARPRGDA